MVCGKLLFWAAHSLLENGEKKNIHTRRTWQRPVAYLRNAYKVPGEYQWLALASMITTIIIIVAVLLH